MLRRILFSVALATGLLACLSFTSSAEARPMARGGYHGHVFRGPVYRSHSYGRGNLGYYHGHRSYGHGGHRHFRR